MSGPDTSNCTSITPECPVEYTIYGFTPSLGFNVFFLAFFGLGAFIHTIFSIRYKTWFYGIAMTLGCIGEVLGYLGRVILNNNPWDFTGFKIQIACLIFSPSFIVAGIYVTLQRIVLMFGTAKSRIPATWYTYMFIGFDLISLLLQAIGGGIAAGATTGSEEADQGTDVMMAGIVWQVATLIVFAGLVIDYVVRTRRSWDQVPESARVAAGKTPFKLFIFGVTVAFVTIFTRCIYRIAEMADGWGNELMRNEAEFIILEGFMIVTALFCMTVFHPGYCFPVSWSKTNSTPIELEEQEEQALDKERPVSDYA